jgi:DpnII restriction endonuclease
MTLQKAKQILTQQIEYAHLLRDRPRFCPEFKKWHRDTSVAIERIFGKDGRHLKDFTSISYHLGAFSSSTPDHKFTEAYLHGIENACAVINSMIDELEEYGVEEPEQAGGIDSIWLIERLCNRFHLAARQLRSRHSGRETIEVEDEYDVQDLLHALLHLHFDDIRAEEWTPSYAGGSSRVDFLLKQDEIVIEAKKTRKGLGAKEVGEELIIDIARYQSHPDCKCLICFVYDPEGRIANPRGIENDLNRQHDQLKVLVTIAPKGT